MRPGAYRGWSTYVVPDGHNKNHGGGDGLAHLGETSLLGEDVGITESRFLGIAVVGGDGVSGVAGDVRLGVLEDLAVLDVEPLDLRQVSVAALQELSHHGDLLGSVKSESRAGSLYHSGLATGTVF